MNGIPEAKVAVAVQKEDRFTAPRPAYNAPANAELTTPKVKDNAPAPSLVELAKQSDDEKIRALWANSESKAREAFERAQARKEGKPVAKVTRVRKSKVQVVSIPTVQFGPEDVCDPETFIKRTRSGDYHTPEMKRLFHANGGERFLKAGLSYANAFSILRQEKMKELKDTKK